MHYFVTNLTAAVEILAIGQKAELSLLTPNEKELLLSSDAVACGLLGDRDSAVQHAHHEERRLKVTC